LTKPTPTESVTKSPQPDPTTSWTDDPEKREALIRLVAYSFYERRGYVSGQELEDWLLAEMEVDRQAAAGAEPRQTR
jgi:hypothetical protein